MSTPRTPPDGPADPSGRTFTQADYDALIEAINYYGIEDEDDPDVAVSVPVPGFTAENLATGVEGKGT